MTADRIYVVIVVLNIFLQHFQKCLPTTYTLYEIDMYIILMTEEKRGTCLTQKT